MSASDSQETESGNSSFTRSSRHTADDNSMKSGQPSALCSASDLVLGNLFRDVPLSRKAYSEWLDLPKNSDLRALMDPAFESHPMDVHPCLERMKEMTEVIKQLATHVEDTYIGPHGRCLSIEKGRRIHEWVGYFDPLAPLPDVSSFDFIEEEELSWALTLFEQRQRLEERLITSFRECSCHSMKDLARLYGHLATEASSACKIGNTTGARFPLEGLKNMVKRWHRMELSAEESIERYTKTSLDKCDVVEIAHGSIDDILAR